VVLGLLAGANVIVWGGAWVLFRRVEATASAWNPAPSPEVTAPPPVSGASAPETPEELLPVFATVDGVRVRLITAKPVQVAFHEASYDDAVALRPTGVCGRCRNPTKFTPPRPRDDSLRYLVTHSRGRDTPATSAADIVVRRGTPVLSPVDGMVKRVRRYRLYGRYPDMRVVIRPDGVPDRRVMLLHVGAVHLRPGDPVEASVTVVGAPRRLPFESQVDRYVSGRYPHVHLEVKDASAAGPATA
jgi:hypothetical protein